MAEYDARHDSGASKLPERIGLERLNPPAGLSPDELWQWLQDARMNGILTFMTTRGSAHVIARRSAFNRWQGHAGSFHVLRGG